MSTNNKTKPSIVIIGGIEQGKTAIRSSLWPNAVKVSEDNDERFSVADSVPGRGVLNYDIIELPPILYSLQNEWLSNNYNLMEISKADVILFVLPASSFGYKQEVSFIKRIVNSDYYNNQHVVICLNKSDLLLYDGNNMIGLESISKLLQVPSSLYGSLRNDLSWENFSADSIIPISAVLQWNYDALKEKLWEGVILKINDTTFNAKLPTIVIAGKRGCGKSSTLNALWGLDLPTNKAVACTKYPQLLKVKCGDYEVNVVDLPGIAESLDADMQYTAYYKKYIEKASLLICLSQADTRAYKQDELFYHNLINANIITKNTEIILGINQIDLLFKTKENPDGIDLHTTDDSTDLIREKIDDYYDKVYSKIFKELGIVTKKDVCVFSVWQKWNLNKLMNMILSKLTH